MLIPVEKGVPIEGLEVPKQLYWVLREPAPLAGMQYPFDPWPWAAIHQAGFSDLVSLAPDDYNPAPLLIVFNKELEDLYHGDAPNDADEQENLVCEAVRATHASLKLGRGVVVHCVGGRGRTGTVLGCVLRELGYEADKIIKHLDRLHQARGRDGWPESLWQKELIRRWTTTD
jgi:protein-tyrosine phosphatase